MANRLELKYGTEAQLNGTRLSNHEVAVNTTEGTLRVWPNSSTNPNGVDLARADAANLINPEFAGTQWLRVPGVTDPSDETAPNKARLLTITGSTPKISVPGSAQNTFNWLNLLTAAAPSIDVSSPNSTQMSIELGGIIFKAGREVAPGTGNLTPRAATQTIPYDTQFPTNVFGTFVIAIHTRNFDGNPTVIEDNTTVLQSLKWTSGTNLSLRGVYWIAVGN